MRGNNRNKYKLGSLTEDIREEERERRKNRTRSWVAAKWIEAYYKRD